MSFTESNESRPMSAYERGAAWNDKGMRLLPWVLAAMVPGIGLAPVVFAIDSPAWKTAVVVVQLAFVAAQLAALARMLFCYARARRIWAGMQ